ncbi:olfactory receptor 502-like [Nannospalax galili]|uniref:olfactory receptor 502-like n=1 Tax=Nannospalax galili TaxID=1026970 RepID=UPI00111C167F|nr:olfactory receptor 502-like [Nannospalax galili]
MIIWTPSPRRDDQNELCFVSPHPPLKINPSSNSHQRSFLKKQLVVDLETYTFLMCGEEWPSDHLSLQSLLSLVEKNTISYLGCIIQLDSAAFVGTLECYILAVMAYDRFVAICNPLLYSTKMSTQVCVQLLIGSYTCGFLNAASSTLFFFSSNFCGPNRISHFFCDFSPLVELSCSDVRIPIDIITFYCGTTVVITLSVIGTSYTYILITILKMPSTEGRQKAFSTCTSHLTAVTLYYGTTTFIYVMPKSSYSTDQNKVVSVFYMVLIPMLNPLIYSLKNNEIKGALKRQLGSLYSLMSFQTHMATDTIFQATELFFHNYRTTCGPGLFPFESIHVCVAKHLFSYIVYDPLYNTSYCS